MKVELSTFVRLAFSNPIVAVTALLTLAVIMVNGWTDAPNAIATCVSTRAMKARAAIIMAAIFDFLGVFIMTLLVPQVAATIYNMVDFSGHPGDAVTALCAALIAIVVWATAAWKFGIPTSESHALIAGLTGAAIALHGGFGGVNGDEWMKVVYGLILSTILGFGSGFGATRLIERICKNMERGKTTVFFRRAQIAGGASLAFMHGAQDGQKFMGVFLLGTFLAAGNDGVSNFIVPIWLMALCSAVMALGTSIGGYRIIKSVGMDMVKLQSYQGFAADAGAASCLLLASLTGIPVSTTHTKTTAIMGVGASKRLSAVNWRIVREMVLAWVLTFPGCGLLSFAMVKLFLVIF
ncbi:MAG: inorganic phosphate transporter [Oscillospiraceae bacterium]|jgi:PiT family inorganic phosphate transporter|nr:inorganic phosphate transporter [Oscillospiraceae bacterium]